MVNPWLLVISGGVTIGALAGIPGVIAWAAIVGIAALPGRGSWLALVAVATLAAGIGAVRIALDAEPPLKPAVVESVAAEVTVRSVPQSGASGPRAVVRVDRVESDDDRWQPAGGDVLVLFRDHAPDRLGKGDRLWLRWTVSVDDGSGFGRFVRSSGASGWANAHSVSVIERGRSLTTPISRLRELVTRRIVEAIPGDGGALMAGFVTGDDSALSDRARNAFERTGMSHITAVSGSNVAVLLTMWFFIMPTGRLRRTIPALLGVMSVIWLYVLLVGLGPGAVRAGLMATIMLFAARLWRRPDPLTALLTASAMMLLAQPGFADSVGFWLSLAASGAIVLVVDRRATQGMALVRAGVMALVAAQVATLPIIVWTFGAWSPASLLANLIVAPIVSIIFPFAFVIAVLVSILPWAGSIVGWLPGIVAVAILAVVERIGNEAAMLRLGFATMFSIVLLATISAAAIWMMSGETRRWLGRVAWRFPAAERRAGAAALGAGLGVWLAVVLRAMFG